MGSNREPATLKSAGLTWGAYLGLAMSVASTVLIVLSSVDNSLSGVVSLLLLIGGLAMAMYTYRKDSQGAMPYGKAFKLGALVSLVSSVICSSVSYIVIAFVANDYIDLVKQKALAKMVQKVGPEQVDMLMDSPFVTFWFKPSVLAASMCINTVLTGIFISLVLAAIFRSSNPAKQ